MLCSFNLKQQLKNAFFPNTLQHKFCKIMRTLSWRTQHPELYSAVTPNVSPGFILNVEASFVFGWGAVVLPKQGWCSQRLGKAPAVMVGNVSAEETLKEGEWGGERDAKGKRNGAGWLGTRGSAPQTACWCYRNLSLFRELSKTQDSSVGLAFRTYVTNCLGSRLENSQENWIFQENDSLIKRSKVWCTGANFQRAFQIVKIFLLVIAVKTYENSNLRHLATAFFLVHSVPWRPVPSKPVKTKLAAGMIVLQSMVCRDVQRLSCAVRKPSCDGFIVTVAFEADKLHKWCGNGEALQEHGDSEEDGQGHFSSIQSTPNTCIKPAIGSKAQKVKPYQESLR